MKVWNIKATELGMIHLMAGFSLDKANKLYSPFVNNLTLSHPMYILKFSRPNCFVLGVLSQIDICGIITMTKGYDTTNVNL